MEAHYGRQIARHMFNREVLLNRSIECCATMVVVGRLRAIVKFEVSEVRWSIGGLMEKQYQHRIGGKRV